MSSVMSLYRRFVLLAVMLVVCMNLSGCYFAMREKVQGKMEDHEGRIIELEKKVNDLEKHQAQTAKPQP